ncbi:MAG TPA: COX15/CtaA family protein [Verrucomicrobiae bacterium]|nr:COX15/CtaA family protein [Verrucomicrobiae bacterium]
MSPVVTPQPWLHRFAVLTAVATLGLIGMGGLVTSHGAGMAVPDWPTTYGYNMFLFPVSLWKGGIFYEHSHRLWASLVGLLTTILAVWLWIKEPRRWLRWLGTGAWFAVVLQGVLGGLRVTLYKDQIGIFHATLAQLFFIGICAIALFTSAWWIKAGSWREAVVPEQVRRLILASTLLVLLQLVLGATMRHQHAGLAVPDFPLAYGKLWPATDAASLDAINHQRLDSRDFKAITATQIQLHMAHRVGAVLTSAMVLLTAWQIRRLRGLPVAARRLGGWWAGLILAQFTLGVVTVLSNKAADIATAHVLCGALSLLTGSLLAIISLAARTAPVSATSRETAASHALFADTKITAARQ